MNKINQYYLNLAVQIKAGGRAGEKAMSTLYYDLLDAALTFIKFHLPGIWEEEPGLDEDIYQEAMLAISKKIMQEDISDIPAYLYAILRNKIADVINRKMREREAKAELAKLNPDDARENYRIELPCPVRICIEKERRKRPKNWEIIELHYMQGYSYKEIAEKLHKGISDIKVRGHRFIQRVKRCILKRKLSLLKKFSVTKLL